MATIAADTKRKLLTFFVPFVIFGIWFSIIGIDYVANYPLATPTPIDFGYAIFCAFFDIGISAGVAALCIVSISDKIVAAVRKRNQHSNREQ